MSSSYGHNLRLTIFGQSHSPAIGVTIEGLPAGQEVDLDALQRFLERRAPGRSDLSTRRREEDRPVRHLRRQRHRQDRRETDALPEERRHRFRRAGLRPQRIGRSAESLGGHAVNRQKDNLHHLLRMMEFFYFRVSIVRMHFPEWPGAQSVPKSLTGAYASIKLVPRPMTKLSENQMDFSIDN